MVSLNRKRLIVNLMQEQGYDIDTQQYVYRRLNELSDSDVSKGDMKYVLEMIVQDKQDTDDDTPVNYIDMITRLEFFLTQALLSVRANNAGLQQLLQRKEK